MKKHKDNYHYKILKVDGYTALIRKALESKGLYNDSLEITIHMLACCLTRYAEIQTELDNGDLMVKTCSREKNVKFSISPLFVMLEHQGEQVRKYLRELKLTNLNTASETGDNEGSNDLNKLFNVINGGENKGPHLLRDIKKAK